MSKRRGSVHAVNKVINNLKAGRVVYTNIEGLDEEVQQEHIKVHTGLDDYEFSQCFFFLDISKVREFWKVAKPGSMIIIDEAHKIFNTRDWQSPVNRACADWCSTHRHQGYDVIFMTQAVEKLDGQIRTLVEWTYRYRKVNFFGSLVKSSYLVYAFSGDDTKKPIQAPQKRFYDKKIFQCYKSYVAADIKELGIMKHVNILKHPVFYLLPLVLLLFIYFFSRSGFAKGEIIPGQYAATKKLSQVVTKPSVTISAVGAVAIVLPVKASSPVLVGKSRGVKEKVQVKEKEKFIVTGKMQFDGSECFFIYKSVDDADDVDVKGVEIRSFNLDEVCRCNSKASVDVGYQFSL